MTGVGFYFEGVENLDAGKNLHISISLDGVVISDTISDSALSCSSSQPIGTLAFVNLVCNEIKYYYDSQHHKPLNREAE